MQFFHVAVTASALLAVILLTLQFKLGARQPDSQSPGWGAVAASVLLAICIRFFILLLLARTDFVAMEGDEIARWMISSAWSNNPFFFTQWDGIWLTGSFAYYGAFMRVFDDPLIALQAGNCFAQCLGIIGVAYAGYVVGGSRIAAMAAALLASVGYPFVWLGVGAMSEGPMSSLIAPGFALIVQFLECPREESRKRVMLAVCAGLAVFGLAAHHFIGWIAILSGLPLFGLALFFSRRGLGFPGWIGAGLILLGAGLFPILWMLGSWRYLGGPLVFHDNATKLNTLHMASSPTAGADSPWGYLGLYWTQAGPLLILALGSLMVRRTDQTSRRRWSLGVLVLLILSAFTFRAMQSGYQAVLHRYGILPYTLTIPLAGTAIADAWLVLPQSGRFFRPGRIILVGMFAVFAAGWCGDNVSMSFRFAEFSPSTQWQHDSLTVGYWLKREFNHPQFLTGAEADGPIGVYERDPGGIIWRLMAYTAGSPDRLRGIPHDRWPGGIPPEIRAVITNDKAVPKGFRHVTSIGQWRVLRRS